MGSVEWHWQIASMISFLSINTMNGYCLKRFVRPFLKLNRCAWCTGVVYSGMMLVLYLIPTEFPSYVGVTAIGIFAAFLVMYYMDHRNLEQKIFLAVVFLFMRWFCSGMTGAVYNILSEYLYNLPGVLRSVPLQFLTFLFILTVKFAVNFLLLLLAIGLLHRVYANKRNNIAWKEMVIVLIPFVSWIMNGLIVSHYNELYEIVVSKGTWKRDYARELFYLSYYAVHYVTMLTVIILYQKLVQTREEEKQSELLYGQVEDMKRHICEVEGLYRDIRGLRHDMGNHIMTLEHLYQSGEHEEAGKYAAHLKAELKKNGMDMKSGNPVTDVILTEKYREAKQKGIRFAYEEFRYPQETRINAFDVSVILNNALSNAIEAASLCEEPFVKIRSYRQKNAYMIEIKNNDQRQPEMDVGSGLPVTSKAEKQGHGYGLINIRRVAQKYQGDLDVRQEGNCFILSVMLMVDAPEDASLPKMAVW